MDVQSLGPFCLNVCGIIQVLGEFCLTEDLTLFL